MGMVFAHGVPGHAGRLFVWLVRGVAQFHHGVEDAALHGLEAILHPGQGALHDDVLGVWNHGGVHDLLHRGLHDGLVDDDFVRLLFTGHQRFPPSRSKLSSRLKSA